MCRNDWQASLWLRAAFPFPARPYPGRDDGMDRGGDMTDGTRFLWAQIHNDSFRVLEQAIEKLAADVHARTNAPANMLDRIEQNIAERRGELHDALVSIVARVDELAAVRVE